MGLDKCGIIAVTEARSGLDLRPGLWAEVYEIRYKGKDLVVKVPRRCPLCKSRKVTLSFYPNKKNTQEVDIECEGCWSVIAEVKILKV